MRLDRFLYHHSPHGRRAIRPILAAGRVRVDGEVEKDSQCEVGDFTQVELDGVLLRTDTPVYIMLNKPAGYLSATTDAQHPTVMELIDEPQTLHIAGRLDRASTGLLILTNDGKWSRRLTDPPGQKSQGVPKVYLVETADPVTEETHAHFARGIYFAYEDLTTRPADLEVLAPHQAKLTIYEGRYHQIKRMFHAVGNRVTALHRVSVGDIHLDPGLESGRYRYLTDAEVASILPANDIGPPSHPQP